MNPAWKETSTVSDDAGVLDCYSNGEWRTVPWPLADIKATSLDEQLERGGYEQGMTYHGALGDSSWSMEAHCSTEDRKPAWLVQVTDGEGGFFFGADTPADVLDLFARWSPMLTADALAHIYDYVWDRDHPDERVTRRRIPPQKGRPA